ncbi:MAG: hypothetical protein V7749_00690 [Cocleimonas sp.]
MFDKMSRTKQIDFLKLWSSLKSNNSSDKGVIESLKDDYEKVYGECQESIFCEKALKELSNWNGGFPRAMEGGFDDDLVLLVKVTKTSDNVENSLNKLLAQTETWFKLKFDIFMSILTNGLFVLFAASTFILMSTKGISFAIEGLKPEQIVGMPALLQAAGVFIENKKWILLVLILGLPITALLVALFYVGQHRNVLDKKIPFFGFYSANLSSKFFTLLDVMIMSGLSIRHSLEYMQKTGLINRYINVHIEEMLYRLKERRSYKNNNTQEDFNTFDTGLLPERLRLRLKIMSKSNDKFSQSSIMDTISQSLIKDYGDQLLAKVKITGRVLKMFSAIVIVFSMLTILDLMFLKINSLQMM